VNALEPYGGSVDGGWSKPLDMGKKSSHGW